jgi:hypothetical protein
MINRGVLKLIGNIAKRLAVILIILLLGIYKDKLFEALLCLVMWLQFELAYQQFGLYKASQEPHFALFLEKGDTYHNLRIKNVSPFPAYMVKLVRILDKNLKPISPNLWEKEIIKSCIPCLIKPEVYRKPYELPIIGIIPRNFYNKYLANHEGYTEIFYRNQFNEDKSFFCYFTKYDEVIPITKEKVPIGFLLTTPSLFINIFNYFKAKTI